ncbi:Small archaeal modifier protein 2 [Metallosphaera sp. J1]|uniref:MoaD/ThiS family protein n=1 Tax=Metallosphaera TaxID=41980 RepID=UPI001EDED1E2|nr:MoaD/ThiS family protein [Metallosphaera javensis (ex Hofmann et al. 2022)]MCG3108245.1 Small archaeal modifier protein 2 [Metallosphaera javensis (ex Hofmann et al. 2022)]BCS93879.1 MAG: amall archaeal modifier protein 2 [Metallosphaera javensis (ex Sakai et al. 2022)]
MKVIVYLPREKREKEVELNPNSTVRDLVRKLGLTVQGSVVLRDGVPLLEDEKVKDGEKLTVVQTASGG